MRVFISYKFAGEDTAQLRTVLEDLSQILVSLGHETFIFSRDVRNWGKIPLSNGEIIRQVFTNLANCDAILILVNRQRKSEGMLLEAGYAKALGLPMTLAINRRFPSETLRLLRTLASQTIEFTDWPDLKIKLHDAFAPPPSSATISFQE